MNINSNCIILGSRKSALAQKHISILEKTIRENKELKDIIVKKKFFKTSGDLFQNKKISELGNKGLFSKEIDEALLASKINLGVHSLKDIPTILPEGLEIAAVLEREDFRDAVISNKNLSLLKLKKNAVIGTSSIRRSMQLKEIRPDLIIEDIRGNIDTRIEKLKKNNFDAIILAVAGLKRLGCKEKYKIVNTDIIAPSLGQGAIALVVNKKNKSIKQIINKLNHPKTYLETECERIFLNALDGSCQTPVGGFAVLENQNKILFNYTAFSKDGQVKISDKVVFNIDSFRSESYDLGVKIKKKID
ncbi:MAG: hydroxymethylbilane synthase [Alphaproteobacteria bacterium]